MRIRWIPLAILVLCTGPAIASGDEATPRVGIELSRATAGGATVRALVVFREPIAAGGATSARRRSALATRRDDILAATGFSGRVRRTFALVPAVALDVDAAALAALAAHPDVLRIDLDAGGSGHLAEAEPLANVSLTLAAGLLGQGTKIAIVDSGIDTDHADFAGRIVGQQCFCSGVAGAAGCCPNGADTQSGPGAAEDDHGHGTNVSGIAAGGGAVALRGSAPMAQIVSVKVLDNTNSFCCASDVVAALDWIRVNHPDADVVNASLGTGMLFNGTCDAATSFTLAMASAVNGLVGNGTIVFVSSGNQGSATQVAAPACLQNAVAVGAVWDAPGGAITFLGCSETSRAADQATCFTNSNATVDLYAPGAFLVASGRGGGTSNFGGTSQATPLSAGCAASIRAIAEPLTPAGVKALLLASPIQVIDAKNGLAFPRLDCADAASRAGMFTNGFER